ncbi:MAG: hypothetical protein EON47_20455 [Acetobacteraceae bacterium]|nr:MAG: hypothetical protein EON47_20455 [Acetobacteraceae bacterium]
MPHAASHQGGSIAKEASAERERIRPHEGLVVDRQRPALSLNTAGVMAISRREDGLLQGGADPRRAARVMGW